MSVTYDDLKSRLRAAFVAARRRKMPNYHSGADLEKALDPAARNCIAAAITPEDYITSLYQAYAGVMDKFYPNQITGVRALNIAKQYASNYRPITPAELWTSQLGLLRQSLVTKRSVEALLADSALAFSAWFRIVATVKPNHQIIKKFGSIAKKELTKELRAFLEKTVPAEHLQRITEHERFV